MPGRPSKKSKRTDEGDRRKKVGNSQPTQQTGKHNLDLPPSLPGKMSERSSGAKCNICHKEAHNRATCKVVSMTFITLIN